MIFKTVDSILKWNKEVSENSLYGTEFEVRLRNEMTQKAIEKECADWIRRKVTFKSNVTGENMGGFMTVDVQEKPRH